MFERTVISCGVVWPTTFDKALILFAVIPAMSNPNDVAKFSMNSYLAHKGVPRYGPLSTGMPADTAHRKRGYQLGAA